MLLLKDCIFLLGPEMPIKIFWCRRRKIKRLVCRFLRLYCVVRSGFSFGSCKKIYCHYLGKYSRSPDVFFLIADLISKCPLTLPPSSLYVHQQYPLTLCPICLYVCCSMVQKVSMNFVENLTYQFLSKCFITSSAIYLRTRLMM